MEDKSNTTVLIIGGAGFIGSHFAERLIKEGYKKVIVVDSLVSGKKEYIHPDAMFFELDMGDTKVKDILGKEKPEIVYDFAGPVHFIKPPGDPLFEHGLRLVESTTRLLDYVADAGVKRFVFSSSGGAIDTGATILPTPEDYPAHPSSLYGLMSLVIEKLIQTYHKNKKIPYTIFRLSNVYGPRQWDVALISSLITKISNGIPPTLTGDGEETLDLVFVEDVCGAFLKALSVVPSGIYNVSTATETTLNEVLDVLSKKLNWHGKPEYASQKEGRAKRNVLDFTKIKKELGWEPKISLSDGLDKTIQWYKSNSLQNKV